MAFAFHALTSYTRAVGVPHGEHIRIGVPPQLESAFWRQDPSIEPRPYKVYDGLPSLPLPRDFTPIGPASLDVEALARLALYTNGLLNRTGQQGAGRVVEYRTAGATGARYHLELYFVCGDLPDLEAGVYHYAADQHSLRPLRRGDFRAAIVTASGDEPFLAQAPVIAAFTSTFWRNAYTYKARAYRHAFWDCGTSLANFTGVATALEQPTRIVLGFVDRDVNHLLGVDGQSEATLALCGLGRARAPMVTLPVAPIQHPVQPISAREVVFPAIVDMHAASSLDTPDQVRAWRSTPLRRAPSTPQNGPRFDLQPVQLPDTSIEDVILARRSTRRYDTTRPLDFGRLSTLLELSAKAVPFDCLDPTAAPLHDEYLIVNAVDGLVPGVYFHDVTTRQLELLYAGDFREAATRLAVNQTYAGDAHVNLYYLADLHQVVERYGDRGYRLAQLESALFAGRLNLAAHALGLGGVGSTSYDAEVEQFFSPHAAGKSYLFVSVTGVRKPRPRLAT
jgi:SagB-type dehydrogenase family enzyme